MADATETRNPSGMSDDEAKELHGYFIRGLQVWVAVSFIAHVLTYQWLPWFPG